MRIIFTDNFGNGPVLISDFLAEKTEEPIEEETMEEILYGDNKPSPDETITDFELGK